MGDRRNLVLEYDEAAVALYTHWGGSELPLLLRDTLRHSDDRWTDPSYFARILFSAMVRDDIDGHTGYGIEAVKLGSETYCEASSRDFILSVNLQSIRLKSGGVWTYKEFANLTDEEISRL